MGKSSINGPFSMAMLNNQRVLCFVCIICFSQPAGLRFLRLLTGPVGTENNQRAVAS